MRIVLWILLFVIHWVIAGLSAVGTLSLLCLWKGDLMFLVWDYPGLSIGLLAGVFSCIMCMCAKGIRWRVLSKLPVVQPVKESWNPKTGVYKIG